MITFVSEHPSNLGVSECLKPCVTRGAGLLLCRPSDVPYFVIEDYAYSLNDDYTYSSVNDYEYSSVGSRSSVG